MRNIHKLQKEGYILELMNVAFEKYRPCGVCQAEKQVGSTTSYKEYHDNNKTFGDATYGLVWSYRLH
jgi:hypothetical protein